MRLARASAFVVVASDSGRGVLHIAESRLYGRPPRGCGDGVGADVLDESVVPAAAPYAFRMLSAVTDAGPGAFTVGIALDELDEASTYPVPSLKGSF